MNALERMRATLEEIAKFDKYEPAGPAAEAAKQALAGLPELHRITFDHQVTVNGVVVPAGTYFGSTS